MMHNILATILVLIIIRSFLLSIVMIRLLFTLLIDKNIYLFFNSALYFKLIRKSFFFSLHRGEQSQIHVPRVFIFLMYEHHLHVQISTCSLGLWIAAIFTAAEFLMLPATAESL